MRNPVVRSYSAIVIAVLFCFSAAAAYGQSADQGSQGSASAPNILVPNQQGQQGQGSSSAGQVANVPGAPNAQAYSVTLRNFLQNRPEVMDQLKLLLIQRMRDDGSLVDDQTVTDQMVYEHMQSDPEFRADAIHSLIDQGYISEDDAKALLGAQNNPAYAQGYQPRKSQPEHQF